jgi:LysM repeat protein
MVTSGGDNKACFYNKTQSKYFYVQYNPTDMSMSEKATYKASQEHTQSRPKLEFEKGDATQLKMKLVFDASDEIKTGGNVDTTYVQELRSFLTAIDTGETTNEGKKIYKPPECDFIWGDFKFEGVVETVKVKYLMFSTGGAPVRAEVDVTLKERHRPAYATSAGSSVQLAAASSIANITGVAATREATTSSPTNDTSTTEVMPGETLSDIESRTGVPMRWIADANGIDDPMNIVLEELILPATAELAAILETQLIAREEGDPVDPIWMERLSGPATHEEGVSDPAIFDTALAMVGGEMNSAGAVDEYAVGEFGPAEGGAANPDFFAEAAESGPPPEFAEWTPGESDIAIREYLGADAGDLEGGAAMGEYSGELAESGPAPEAATSEAGDSEASATGFGAADNPEMDSQSATEEGAGGELEGLDGGDAITDHEATLAESGPAPEAATSEAGDSEASATGFGAADNPEMESQASTEESSGGELEALDSG